MRITKKMVLDVVERILQKADEYKRESVKFHRAGEDAQGRHRNSQSLGLRIAAIEVQNALLTAPNALGTAGGKDATND
jgi:hypothetical protein